MGKITVMTAISGNKDSLRDDQVKGGAKWMAFIDTPQYSETWEVRKAYDHFTDPRRNSRVPKILSHQFCDTEYSIWMDGNMALLKSPEELVERYLKDHDFALFKHPIRTCIYGEAMETAKRKLDDPETIIAQAKKYEDAGYEKDKGLYECGFLLRRNTDKVRQFEALWWAEYTTQSCRDQISFAYAADLAGLRLKVLDAPWRMSEDNQNVYRDDFISMRSHTILNPR